VPNTLTRLSGEGEVFDGSSSRFWFRRETGPAFASEWRSVEHQG
jgi:hypothetical protein